jgi:hypothetical protein
VPALQVLDHLEQFVDFRMHDPQVGHQSNLVNVQRTVFNASASVP